MEAAQRIGEMAEEQQHHPDLHVAWGRLTVDIWTHKIGGLTESDFVFAAKCDALIETSRPKDQKRRPACADPLPSLPRALASP